MITIVVPKDRVKLMTVLWEEMQDVTNTHRVSIVKKADELFSMPGVSKTRRLDNVDWENLREIFQGGICVEMHLGDYSEYQMYCIKPEYATAETQALLAAVIGDVLGYDNMEAWTV